MESKNVTSSRNYTNFDESECIDENWDIENLIRSSKIKYTKITKAKIDKEILNDLLTYRTMEAE